MSTMQSIKPSKVKLKFDESSRYAIKCHVIVEATSVLSDEEFLSITEGDVAALAELHFGEDIMRMRSEFLDRSRFKHYITRWTLELTIG